MNLIMVMATTVDGKIARHNTHFPDWTSSEDKRIFKQMTQASGVVVMGSRTYQTIGKPLPRRLNVVMTRRPEQYEPSEQLLFTAQPPEKVLEELSSRGYESAALIGGETINNLFAQAGLITELVITIAPKIFGTGLSLFSCSLDIDLSLASVQQLDSDHVMIRYGVVQS